MSGFTPDIALDALFRRNVATRGDTMALLDLDGVSMSYNELAGAVAEVAEQIATLHLPQRSVIALLLPNGRELTIALLAAMRSGHVAVPMPVAWRKSDLVRACREAEAAVLVTTANFAAEDLPALAAKVAIEVFELSFPCAFGAPLPDGLVPLTFGYENRSHANAPISDVHAPGIGTLQAVSGGVSLVLHRDEELLAAGLGAMLAGGMQNGDKIVSAVSLTTFAGLASVFVPWLLSAGTLTLLPEVPRIGAIEFDKQTHLIATAGFLPTLCAAGGSAVASAFAIHFSGTEPLTAFPALNANKVVDVVALGEVCVIALPRRERSVGAPVPVGEIHAGDAGAGSPVILETRVENNLLFVRGAAVPADAIRDQEWLDTGFATAAHGTGSVYVTPPEELLSIGTLSFNCPDLERRIRSAALVSDVYALTDPILGAKLVITSDRPAETTEALLNAGLPQVIAHAVRNAETLRAKAS